MWRDVKVSAGSEASADDQAKLDSVGVKSARKKPTTLREDGTNQLRTSPRSGSLEDQGGHASAKAAHWQRRRESRRQGRTKLPTRLAKRWKCSLVGAILTIFFCIRHFLPVLFHFNVTLQLVFHRLHFSCVFFPRRTLMPSCPRSPDFPKWCSVQARCHGLIQLPHSSRYRWKSQLAHFFVSGAWSAEWPASLNGRRNKLQHCARRSETKADSGVKEGGNRGRGPRKPQADCRTAGTSLQPHQPGAHLQVEAQAGSLGGFRAKQNVAAAVPQSHNRCGSLNSHFPLSS